MVHDRRSPTPVSFSCFVVSLGCFPRSRPLALATFIPSRVRIRIRSASNSEIIASTLNSSLPIGSVGSWGTADAEFDFAAREVIGDFVGVPDGTGRAVKSGNDEGISGPASG